MRDVALLLSCEHGGNRVPARWRAALRPAAQLLATHRGYDAGALVLARRLARVFEVPLHAATVTRLVVDLNRSATHPRVLSRFTAALDEAQRREILATLHTPHRMAVRAAALEHVRRGTQVVHVAVHSFTPVLDGVHRNADVGLLYDPARPRERSFAHRWRTALAEHAPALRVRSNYPYRGVADGLTRWLRGELPDRDYAGLELEMNQALLAEPQRWRAAMRAIEASLAACLR